ncbi:hypothetical protein SO078_16805 (plasmid) [Sinorhizobium meliloti]|uniref:hypothetical protein n=1 Tax=Rhizobium meliloti TaxID=382 RepID=UPI002D777A46|nr:hypothetical protein [Sinorhizobium meliloti]WRQ70132.1 hypothetical protein SO078_16805 [Sinorhizobium meliloti]
MALGGGAAETLRPEHLDEDSAVALLHHDPCREMGSLEVALESKAFCIGALGRD